jgi:hypothetical protein
MYRQAFEENFVAAAISRCCIEVCKSRGLRFEFGSSRIPVSFSIGYQKPASYFGYCVLTVSIYKYVEKEKRLPGSKIILKNYFIGIEIPASIPAPDNGSLPMPTPVSGTL